ncbi:MAG TPA: sulfatase-like hydrolase/transferase [bacterium]|nr:sulfatase-like hydrolase/transferase [bacterium]
MKSLKKFFSGFFPVFDRYKLILLILFTTINIVFIFIVVSKNEFSLDDPLVVLSFLEKIIFDTVLFLFFIHILKALDKKGWLTSLFIVFNVLLLIANILLYYFGNTLVEKHHFDLITPYSVTAFIPWYGLILVFFIVIISFVLSIRIIRKVSTENLIRQSGFYFMILIFLTLFNISGMFARKNDEKLDKVIMGFRNAQIYYACQNQFLSFMTDVLFPSLGEKFKYLSPATESFVDDYNLFSSNFSIEQNISQHSKTIEQWNLGIGKTELTKLNLKPFSKVIYIITESVSLEALPCHNPEIKSTFATEFFCKQEMFESTFTNLYTSGSPTLQGLTVIFNSHPNYNIQEQTGQINSFPKLLEKKGFKSVFIRSASKFFANENLVFKNMGFSEIIGREDFFEEEALKKYIYGWGIEDRILYKKALEYIEKDMNKPLFIAIFGTDTHPPYGQIHFKHLSYPAKQELKKKYSQNVYNWLKAVDNMDYDINNFIKELDSKGLFDESTLIVISADHSCPLNNVSSEIPGHEKNNLAKIPLIFISKQKLPEVDRNILSSQIDIAPTIFNLLGFDKAYGWWGDSLFNPGRIPQTIGFDKGFIRISNLNTQKIINSGKPADESEKAFVNLFNTVFMKAEKK